MKKMHITKTTPPGVDSYDPVEHAAPQPTPDVSVLVGALERIERMDFDDHSLFNAVLVARAALAAHRKGGEV